MFLFSQCTNVSGSKLLVLILHVTELPDGVVVGRGDDGGHGLVEVVLHHGPERGLHLLRAARGGEAHAPVGAGSKSGLSESNMIFNRFKDN